MPPSDNPISHASAQLPDPASEAGANTPALLLPIFRNEAQARLLAELYARPDPSEEYSLVALGLATGVWQPTVEREIAELIEAGLLSETRSGEIHRYVRIRAHPAIDSLARLIAGSYGAKPLLERGLREIAGIDHALLRGEWAARYRGVPGLPPYEIELVVIGRPDHASVYRLTNAIEQAVGCEINVVIMITEVWSATPNPFRHAVQQAPRVHLLR